MLSLIKLALASAAILPLSLAHPLDGHHDEEAHISNRALPNKWYHDDDHFARALFRRQDSAPAVGSSEWVAQFPAAIADPSKMPKEWKDALDAAVAANKIPNIPQSKVVPNVGPVYDKPNNPNGKEICSATYKCRNPDDIWDAPEGVFALNFDDGPLPESDPLYDYLKKENQHATHFMIGLNIIRNQKQFKVAYEDLQDDIAVHTWSHQYMTSLTNEQITAELGFTIKAISDLTGGRLPRYWRPPMGDSDNRVRAIAIEVFGLECVIWNQDTEDWSLTTGGTTPQIVASSLEKWIKGPKSPGLIILEHELSVQSVQAFINAFPLVKQNGWNPMPVTQIRADMKPWKNADSNTGSVTSMSITDGDDDGDNSSSASVSSASTSASASGSASASASANSASKASSVADTARNTASSPSPSAQAAQSTNDALTHVVPTLTVTVGIAIFSLFFTA